MAFSLGSIIQWLPQKELYDDNVYNTYITNGVGKAVYS